MIDVQTRDGLTPLHMAAQNGNLEVFQLLLDHKANINAVDSKGWTPWTALRSGGIRTLQNY